MLAFFDKYQSLIIGIILAFYLANSIYIGSSTLSFILFLLVIAMQVIRLRKHIKKLSFLQLILILAIMVGSLVGMVFMFMGLNHLISIGVLSLPDWMIMVTQITLIILFIVSVSAIIRTLYQRFTQQIK